MHFTGIMGLGNDKSYSNVFDLGYKNGDLISSTFAFEIGIGFLGQPSHFYYNVSRNDFPTATFLKIKSRKWWNMRVDNVDINGVKY